MPDAPTIPTTNDGAPPLRGLSVSPADLQARRADLERQRGEMLGRRPSLALASLTDPAAAEDLTSLDRALAHVDQQLLVVADATAEAERQAAASRVQAAQDERRRRMTALDAAKGEMATALGDAERAAMALADVLARVVDGAKAVDAARGALGKQPAALHAARIRIAERGCWLLWEAVRFTPAGRPAPLGSEGDVPA